MVCAVLIIVLYVPALRSLIPPGNDLSVDRGEDWHIYHRYAMSVLRDGMTMPGAAPQYRRPGGFGYVYFVAGLYALFGARSEAVYLVQSVMLVISIAVMAVLGWRCLQPVYAAAYAITLTVTMWLDMYRWYAHRLLSENLLVFILPFLFLSVLRAIQRGSYPSAITAGLLAGAAVLVRPNVILFALFVFVLMLAWRRRLALAYLLCFVVIFALMPLRNYARSGKLSMIAITSPRGWDVPPDQRITDYAAHYGRRIAFVVGFTPVLEPSFRVRPHWLAMWTGVILWLWSWIRSRRRLEPWEMLLLGFLVLYLVPLIAVGQISTYGFRMISPAVPATLLLAFRGVELSLTTSRRVESSDEDARGN